MLHHPIVLASASPRRQRVLRDLGLTFRVMPPAVEEVAIPDDPAATATTNASRKHAWCLALAPTAWIIAADTVIDLDGTVMGKPQDLAVAAQMLRAFAGREHQVLTAVALSTENGAAQLTLTRSRVRFRPLSDAAIRAYFGFVNPLDKAGGYDIADHGGLLIESHTGSWSNITGLPIEVIVPWIARYVRPNLPPTNPA